MPLLKTTVATITQSLAAVAAAEGALATARQLLDDKRGQLQASKDEIAQLDVTLTDADEIGITRRAMLQGKIPLIERAIKGRVSDVERAEARLVAEKATVRVALAEAAKEIGAERKAALVAAIAPLQDDRFAQWCGERAPSVTSCETFARNVDAAVGQLGLSLEQLSKIIISGTVPAFQAPQAPLASLVALSQQPPWAS